MNPFEHMPAVQQSLAAPLPGQSRQGTNLTPRVAVWEDVNGMNFQVSLPHVQPGDIELGFIDGILTLRAPFRIPAIDSLEIRNGVYVRRFGLATIADRYRVTARFFCSTLTITVPHVRDRSSFRHIVPVQKAA